MRIVLLITLIIVGCKNTSSSHHHEHSHGHKNKHDKQHHYTHKLGGHMSVSFQEQGLIQLNISSEVEDFKLELFHKKPEQEKELLADFLLPESELSVSDYTADLKEGYLFAVISGKLNGRIISNSASYKIDEQNRINSARKKLQKRSLKYAK